MDSKRTIRSWYLTKTRSFSSTLRHARADRRTQRSRARNCAENGHHRLDVVTNDEAPAVAVAGSGAWERGEWAPSAPVRPSGADSFPRVGGGCGGGN
ncbi:hypothetical protein EVAR_38926_1 [Eumeta japonica]|uniref:Uncharacterized protein n=1 Tax=Eumeta variegata TaxID=151549 RepID=A0A4C1ZQ46_EUMVA|nr:hypothetical protein EVAR_38926_1 [Eumeta japonica]